MLKKLKESLKKAAAKAKEILRKLGEAPMPSSGAASNFGAGHDISGLGHRDELWLRAQQRRFGDSL